ncbi:MAG: acyl-CoA dehydrogenase family protein, partial [Thermomicrobiales bacterium]
MNNTGFNETQQMIRQTMRDYLTREIEPLVPDMEAGTLLPYEPTSKMVRDLGLGASGELAQLIAESPSEEHLKRFVPRVLSVEMARVCGGMALSHGATT